MPEDRDTIGFEIPEEERPDDSYINTRGASLNYVRWERAREVYCADKNSPGAS